MGKMTLWQNGCVFGIPPAPRPQSSEIALRRATIGWTPSATRNLTKWLYGANVDHLGEGFAFTLTVRDLPIDANEWKLTRAKFFKRLKRLGVVNLHWLTEWQLRKIPHLHGCLWFPKDFDVPPNIVGLITDAWLKSSKQFKPEYWCQDVKWLETYKGWKQYLSKHASRSAHNSQRCSSNMPDTWKTSGRMWGYWGEWTEKKFVINICQKGGFAYRRIIKGWRLASARSEKDDKKRVTRIRSAKSMYRSNIKNLSQVRGLSEWLDIEHQLKIVDHLILRGFSISSSD